jgi:23S rRNA (cytidine1920-2'-O)/16S rRNA (cytidine1409-2'-O)-methyltransferase
VRAPEEHARVIAEVSNAARKSGYDVLGVTESPLQGPKGNKEFLLYLRLI